MNIGPENPLRFPHGIEVAKINLPSDNKEGFTAMNLWLRQNGLLPENLLYRGCNGARLERILIEGTDRDDVFISCMDFETLKDYPANGLFHPLKLARQHTSPMVLMYDSRLVQKEIGYSYSFKPEIHPTAALQQVLLINGEI